VRGVRYVVLLPGDESGWAAATPEERTAVYAKHEEFSKKLAAGGHTVTGGAELTHSREAQVVRVVDGTVTVTDGPYAETVEQLTGYYEVETDNLDDLLQVVAILAGDAHDRAGMGGVEVRRVVTDEDRAS
jgi:hypothetical protein